MPWYFDLIGYLGMAFVIISFLCKRLSLLRILNLIGGSLCMVYGFITKTYPTAILNLILVIVNLWYTIIYFIKKRRGDN